MVLMVSFNYPRVQKHVFFLSFTWGKVKNIAFYCLIKFSKDISMFLSFTGSKVKIYCLLVCFNTLRI